MRLGDLVVFKHPEYQYFGNMTYEIIKAHGWWIFKTYDLECYTEDETRVRQMNVSVFLLRKVGCCFD
jgi:hypothetical protein